MSVLSSHQLISFSIILIFSLILSIQDLKRQSVKLYIQVISILCALICQMVYLRAGSLIYILSSLLMVGFYFAVRKITKGKLGMADIYFGSFQGLFLMPFFIPVCLVIESLVALVINKRFGKKKFAFIPFMGFGLVISYLIEAGVAGGV